MTAEDPLHDDSRSILQQASLIRTASVEALLGDTPLRAGRLRRVVLLIAASVAVAAVLAIGVVIAARVRSLS